MLLNANNHNFYQALTFVLTRMTLLQKKQFSKELQDSTCALQLLNKTDFSPLHTIRIIHLFWINHPQVNDNAQKIAKEGAVAPLIALLKNWIPTVLTSAMCALCNLGTSKSWLLPQLEMDVAWALSRKVPFNVNNYVVDELSEWWAFVIVWHWKYHTLYS